MITMDIKQYFFDQEKVIRATTRAKRQALSKAGAFIRTRARSSMRRRKKISAPGTPPSARRGDLKKFLYFGYDPVREGVVVGPVGFARSSYVVPELLEFGGSVPGDGQFINIGGDLPGTRQLVRADRPVDYKARPFMGPALEAEVAAGTIAKTWANSVRSS